MKNTNSLDAINWVEEVPQEVWNLLEDWGYFRQDINLRDVINVTASNCSYTCKIKLRSNR